MEFDVRKDVKQEITSIVFANYFGADTYAQASKVCPYILDAKKYICIEDADGNSVVINTVEDAKNLIAVINKAIELGWLEK